ncbi:MAG TPA: BT_3928 family protein [Bacteroidales bacterium]|nr:BT_3928 family protein [Bacteroidales bacterium]
MNILRSVSKYIAGFVFIFTGITKGIDPIGSMYKFADYFAALGVNGSGNLALLLGVILCLTEFIIGFSLLAGIRTKLAAWGLLIFMVFFTPLTFILAIYNPVTDCGCFGDALHMTNWQTFFKNLGLSAFVIVVFVERDNYKNSGSSITQWIAAVTVTFIFFLFVDHNYNHLPVVDFRPYSKGTNIPEDMKVPEGAPVDEYETTLIYEKEGLREEFSLDNYPSNDTTWVFIDQKSRLIRRGYTPPVHDINLSDLEGFDLTDSILTDPGLSLIMITKRLSAADQDALLNGFEAGFEVITNGISFYVITSSPTEEVLEYSNGLNFLFADETTLKTIIRSDPGYVVLKEGTITEKWASVDLPGSGEIIGAINNSYPVKVINEYVKLSIIILLTILLALAFSYTARKVTK